jgi:hypothetical protein
MTPGDVEFAPGTLFVTVYMLLSGRIDLNVTNTQAALEFECRGKNIEWSVHDGRIRSHDQRTWPRAAWFCANFSYSGKFVPV